MSKLNALFMGMILGLIVEGCAPVDEPKAVVQAGTIGVPLPPSGLPALNGCQRKGGRLLLVGVSFQSPDALGARLSGPDSRPNPSLSTSGGTPWYPQLINEYAATRYLALSRHSGFSVDRGGGGRMAVPDPDHWGSL